MRLLCRRYTAHVFVGLNQIRQWVLLYRPLVTLSPLNAGYGIRLNDGCDFVGHDRTCGTNAEPADRPSAGPARSLDLAI